jgi:hypothetical protein
VGVGCERGVLWTCSLEVSEFENPISCVPAQVFLNMIHMYISIRFDLYLSVLPEHIHIK